MGNRMSLCWPCKKRIRNANRKITLLLVGLDNAGKTTGARRLAGESVDNVLPTVGFSSVKLKYNDHPVTIYDVGGGPQIRNIWTRYYNDAHGLIFMVDASDLFRLKEAKRLFENVLKHEKVAGKPVLVLANKQDKEGALDDIDIVERWDLERLVNELRCPTFVRDCSTALPIQGRDTNNGLIDGYQWLVNQVIKMYDSLNARVEYDLMAEEARIAEERAAWKLKHGELNEAYDEESPNDNISPFQPIEEVITRLEEKEPNGYHKPNSEVFTIYNGANNMPVGVMHEESHSLANGRKKSGVNLLKRKNEVAPIKGLSSGLVPLVSSPSIDYLPNVHLSSSAVPDRPLTHNPQVRLPPIRRHVRPTSSRSLGAEGVWGLQETLEIVYPPKNTRSNSIFSS